MTYILSKQLDQDAVDAHQQYLKYQEYLHADVSRFPPRAHSLATAEWYYGHEDHRCPHDAWLECVKLEESSSGERQENRMLSICIRLLSAYQDHILEFYYPHVYRYSIGHSMSISGNGDWRYDEFRLTDEGHLLHEIEWAAGVETNGSWIIEASDVHYQATQFKNA